MKIAVVGRSGQLAQCLVERASVAGVDLVALGRPELDVLRPDTVTESLQRLAPTIVVNAAAMTAVDLAEADAAAAGAINRRGAELVATAAGALSVPLIHVSTDYVFDGAKGAPYAEDDAPNPLNVYGASKLAGERAVAAANPDHVILRTAWVHSPFGSNFVRAILARAEEADEIEVVADQWGSPTSGLELADAILHVAARLAEGSSRRGIYHAAGRGSINRSGQARAILEASGLRGGPTAVVRDIGTRAGGRRAPRPRNSTLDSTRLELDFGWITEDWRRGIVAVVARLLGDGAPPG
jgi:dTDP-4-dehydrorhamnose reductase